MQYLIEKMNKIENYIKESSTSSKEITLELIGIMKSMAYEIDTLKKSNEELENYINSIDEDLGTMEALFLEEIEDTDYEEICDDDFKEVDCDLCKETIYVDKEIYNSRKDFKCPNCGSIIEFAHEV